MGKNRLEALSDGMIAIIITIMVLEMKVPHGESIEFLMPLIPVFLSYVLSFVYLAIYWNNHHHMIHTCKKVTGPILWANLHLLFWLSLIPFATGWREPFWVRAIRAVRRSASDGSDRVLDTSATDHLLAGCQLDSQEGRRKRLEGQVITGSVRRSDPVGFLVAMGRFGVVRACRAAMAHTGPTD
jgi:Endosomal/lysosomal potassium channel TMEM175